LSKATKKRESKQLLVLKEAMIVELEAIKLLCVGDDFSPLDFEVAHN